MRQTRALKLTLTLAAMAATALTASAQTDAQLSQYYEVPSYYNPAAVGLSLIHI